MTSISKEFLECDLASHDVIDALKSGNQAVIDQVASKIYANILSVADAEIQEGPNWHQKDEKLKWVLHTQVALFGNLLNTEDLVKEFQRRNEVNPKSIFDLAYEMEFLLLDLLALYYELNYSTWNLIDLFRPDDIKEEEFPGFIETAVQLPPAFELMVGQKNNTNPAALNQTLTNWKHWCETYKSLMIRTYNANQEDSIIGFHSMLAVSANLISASHLGWLLLFSRSRSVKSRTREEADTTGRES